MCDRCELKRTPWRGWHKIPAPRADNAIGEWVDLAHAITEDLSRSPAFPRPVIRRIVEMPRDNANVTEIQMVCHHGTHVDAPRHFIMDGPSFDQIPLERLYGPGVVWQIEKGAYGTINAADLERARPKVQPGDIVLLDTGWAKFVNTAEYENHASLSQDAADWLVEHDVKMLGVDFSTPDLTAHRRTKDYDFPVHNTLLSHGVLIAEHVTNLTSLANSRIEAMFLSVNIAGADGGLTRAVARPVES